MRFKVVCGVAVLMAVSTAPGFAGPTEQTAIKAGCQSSTNWSEAACQCLSDQAASLNTDQQAFLAATLNEQKGEAARYALKLTQAQTMQAAMFMAQAGPGCQ